MATTILVVDDSSTMRRVLEMTFAGEDAKVFAFPTGDAALKQIADINPDIVIADTSMGAPDGYDIARSIRQNASTSHIAVLLLASQHNPYDSEKGRSCGVDDYISKPFDSQAMIDRVQQVLSRPRSVVSNLPGADQTASAANAPKPGRTATVVFGSQQPPAAAEPKQAAAAPAAAARTTAQRLPEGEVSRGYGGQSSMNNGPKPTPASFSQPFGASPRAPYGKPILELAEEEPLGVTDMDSELLMDVSESIQPASMPTTKPRAAEPISTAHVASGNPGSTQGTRNDAYSGRDRAEVHAAGSTHASTSTGPVNTADTASSPNRIAGTAMRSARISREQLDALGLTSTQVEAVLALSRDVIEKVVWEVVPELAETIIREEIQRITRE